MAESISNQYISEGTASTDLEISFPWRARWIEVINDSATQDLGYKFNTGETYATLSPLEVANPPIKARVIIINGAGKYRVRAYG